MSDVVKIIWYGRGGQGAFTASKIIGAAYSLGSEHGKTLAFPSFGPERRGAPVRAFTILSETDVNDRSEPSTADYYVYLDENLMSDIPSEGTVIVNTPDHMDLPNVVTVDATGIANENKVPMANTAMAGAVAAVSEIVGIESVFKGIETVMPEKLWANNKLVAEMAYRTVMLDD